MLRGVKEMAFSNLFQLLDIVCLDAYVICKNVGIENDSQRCFLLQLGEALCDAKRKKRKPSIFRLLPVVWNHSGDAGLPKKKQTSCRSSQKNKTKRVGGVKIARIMFAAHAESQFVWNVSQKLSKDYTMWFLQKRTTILCWHHVEETRMNVKTLLTNHFKCFCFFFSNKSMSSMKILFDLLPRSVDHYGTSKCTKVLLNCVCNTPNFVVQLLWSYKFSFFPSIENNFLRFNWLTSIDQYESSCYMHSFLKNHKKLDLDFLIS